MKLDIDTEDLNPIRSDIIDSLGYMRAFRDGEVPQAKVKKFSTDACRKLTRARDKLSKLVGMDI